MTEMQGAMSGLISLIAHPPEVLRSSNEQHRQLLGLLRRGNGGGAAQAMADHLRATEHVLAGLLPV
jgi:DNA-binding GntR family transcriptional regulator